MPSAYYFIGVEEAMTRFMDSMDSKLDNLKERVTEVEDGVSTLQETETSLIESVEQTKKEIVTRCKEITSSVDRWRNKVLKEVETECQKVKDEVDGKKLLLESYLGKLNEEMKEIDDTMKLGDPMIVLRKEEFDKKIKVRVYLFNFFVSGRKFENFVLTNFLYCSLCNSPHINFIKNVSKFDNCLTSFQV